MERPRPRRKPPGATALASLGVGRSHPSAMSHPNGSVLTIATCVFGVAGLALVIGSFVFARALRRRSVGRIAEGVVVASARRISVRYVVDGVPYDITGSTHHNDAPRPGARIGVRYMPGDPTNAVILGEELAGTIAGLVVAVVFGLIGGALVWVAYQVG
jgi:hypothetical protein